MKTKICKKKKKEKKGRETRHTRQTDRQTTDRQKMVCEKITHTRIRQPLTASKILFLKQPVEGREQSRFQHGSTQISNGTMNDSIKTRNSWMSRRCEITAASPVCKTPLRNIFGGVLGIGVWLIKVICQIVTAARTRWTKVEAY